MSEAISLLSGIPLSTEWWIQLGFLGAFIVAMYIMFWLIKARRIDWQTWMTALMELHRETNVVLKHNTTAFTEMTSTLARLCEKLESDEHHTRRVYELLLRRPCMVGGHFEEIKDDGSMPDRHASPPAASESRA